MDKNNNRFAAILAAAREKSTAAAAFNIFNQQTMRGVIAAANAAAAPVILQTSSGTVKRIGAYELGGMVGAARSGCTGGLALHLDHCRDEEIARACIDAGWDSVMMDFSNLPLGENIVRTAAVVRYAHERGAAVEGEVGAIAGVEDEIQSDAAHPATYEDTMRFVHETSVDAIAPAIGTAHGVYASAPKLDFGLIERLGREKCPLVIHGGTGLSDEVFRRIISLGAAKINISTAIKYSFRESVAAALPVCPPESPAEIDKAAEAGVKKTAERLIRLFWGLEI